MAICIDCYTYYVLMGIRTRYRHIHIIQIKWEGGKGEGGYWDLPSQKFENYDVIATLIAITGYITQQSIA